MLVHDPVPRSRLRKQISGWGKGGTSKAYKIRSGQWYNFCLTEVEDPSHCEFTALRNFLCRTHLQDLIETTSIVHYETFRTRQLLSLKESSAKPNKE